MYKLRVKERVKTSIVFDIGGTVNRDDISGIYGRLVEGTKGTRYDECVIDVRGLEFMTANAPEMIERFRREYLGDGKKLRIINAWGQAYEVFDEYRRQGWLKIDGLVKCRMSERYVA